MAGTPDVIWLNGAFGVGKTTVAELLVERIDGATLIDPEVIGEMLRGLLPAGWQTDDFQDMPLWRSLTREAIAGLIGERRAPLVVPMTLVQPDYFDEIVGALRRSGIAVRHFALVARSETILARLGARDAEGNQWARGRVADCVAQMAGSRFAEHIDADACDAGAVAAEILGRLAA